MRKFQGNKLVVATHNEGKLDEVRALFANKSVEILSSKSLDLPEPIETENNFIGTFPRYVLEAIGLLIISISIIVLSINNLEIRKTISFNALNVFLISYKIMLLTETRQQH